MMPPTARAHTPGPEPVNAKVLGADEPVVLLPVEAPVDAAPAELACVALALDDPELGVGAGTKEIFTVV
jgi:hypothetical protein